MDSTFLNARSPLRLLEKGLHGGLGAGNLGLVLAGPGVGKTAFLVGVALDALLRGRHVLHVTLDQTVGHVRDHYATLFEDLAAAVRLQQEAVVHADVDRRRSIRAYSPSSFSPAKLREAVKVEIEAGAKPDLIVLEGFDPTQASRDDVLELRALAREIPAEIWHSAPLSEERIPKLPARVAAIADIIGVILALEPAGEHIKLRALKDHDAPDLSALHVALDPKTLLLVRS